jgi:hypothetical protein
MAARTLQLFTAHQADYFQGEAFPDKTATTGHFVSVHADSGTPSTNWDGRMPPSYNDGDIEVEIHWASVTTNSGAVVWNIEFERLDSNGQVITSDGFASAISVTANPAATTGALKYTVIALTNAQADGILKGESYRMKLTRNTSSGSDTMVGQALVLGVAVNEA